MSLNWFQKLTSNKVEGVVKDRMYGTQGIKPVTIYAVQGDSGSMYFGAMYGHPESPSEGDRVKMYISKIFITKRIRMAELRKQ